MIIVFNEKELDSLLHSKTGPVGRHLAKCGEFVTLGAKRRAPVSADARHGRPPGYMRSRIGWDMGRDALSLYVDISSPARTSDGAPYGLFMEVGTRPHKIYPKRITGVLVFWHGGQLLFRSSVNHPGTRPYAYLRKSLDDLRRA